MSEKPTQESFIPDIIAKHLRTLGNKLEANERNLLSNQNLELKDLLAIHKSQVDLAGAFEWVNNVALKHFPPRIIPANKGMNGLKIIPPSQ